MVKQAAARLAIERDPLDPHTDTQSGELDTTFSNNVWLSTGGHSLLLAGSEFVPHAGQTIDAEFFSFPMNAGDPEIDQVSMATVYVISPPDFGPDTVPDASWEASPSAFRLWNIWHATRYIPPVIPQAPLRFSTGGLGIGLADYLSSALLAPVNDEYAEAASYLQQSDMRGLFWNG